MHSVIPQLEKIEQEALARSLAPARLKRFRAVSKGDREALGLYILDAELSSQLHAVLRTIEVALREHINRAMAAEFGPRWFQTKRDLFDEGFCEKLDEAYDVVGETAPPGKIVAQLMFGTWVGLLGRGGKTEAGESARYNKTLWATALEPSFASIGVSRSRLRRTAMSLNWARNRVSHCEPIVFGLPQAGLGDGTRQIRHSPQVVFEDARTFAGYLEPEIETWLRRWQEIDVLLQSESLEKALSYVSRDDSVQLIL